MIFAVHRWLAVYNGNSLRTTTAVKLAGNPNIPILGTDQITFTETVPAMLDGTPVWRTINQVSYTDELNNLRNPIVSQTDRTPDGLRSWSYQIGQGPTPGDPDDTFTQQGAKFTHTHTTLAGNGNWKEKTTNPDGSSSRTTHTDGRMDIMEIFAAGSDPDVDAPIASVSQIHDTLNRPWKQTDSRTGTTTTSYISTTADFVASVSDAATPARVTKFKYDTRGRRTHVDAPDTFDPAGEDPENRDFENITITAYNPDGTVLSVTGDQTYPVSYTYDYARRMETMTTYRAENLPAATTWFYDEGTGLLERKQYADTKGTDYTHTPAGRLKTRTWARGNHTRYDYTHGRLTGVSYFKTQGLWETYAEKRDAWLALLDDENSTQAQIDDAEEEMNAAKTAASDPDTRNVGYTYDALGRHKTASQGGNRTWTHTYDPATLRLKTESHPVGGSATQRLLTRTTDELGRPETLEAGTILTPDLDFSVSYDYDAAGRVSEVESDAGKFTYGYQPNSYGLIRTVTGQNGTLPIRTVTNTWEANRDVLSLKENKVASDTISSFLYDVNEIGQRTSVTTDGSAFGNADRGWSWGYDSLGQVTKADKTDDASHGRAYAYDGIGNRLTATDNPAGTPVTTIYTPNALNQYEKINAGTEVAPVHDDDGNLREDQGANLRGIPLKYVWDGENRLIEVRLPNESLVARYEYDYLSRRTLAITTIDAPQGAKATAYLYDGWNVVAEYEASTPANPVRLTTHTWGLDLSGTMQGAGGVGGLLAVTKHGTAIEHFYPTYDGNGNVSEYLDEDGEEVAHYQYDPFGRLIAPTGDWQNFQYRFSTKPQAEETGFYYYGYRWYDPATGRWPSRDPIGEWGGLNIRSFVGNSAISNYDLLGLAKPSKAEGAKQIRGSLKALEKECECCVNAEFREICISEAGEAVEALANAWESKYDEDWKDDGSTDRVGGRMCYSWARAYGNVLRDLARKVPGYKEEDDRQGKNLIIWSWDFRYWSNIRQVQEMKHDDDGFGIHMAVKVFIRDPLPQNEGDTCEGFTYDNGFFNSDGQVFHANPFDHVDYNEADLGIRPNIVPNCEFTDE